MDVGAMMLGSWTHHVGHEGELSGHHHDIGQSHHLDQVFAPSAGSRSAGIVAPSFHEHSEAQGLGSYHDYFNLPGVHGARGGASVPARRPLEANSFLESADADTEAVAAHDHPAQQQHHQHHQSDKHHHGHHGHDHGRGGGAASPSSPPEHHAPAGSAEETHHSGDRQQQPHNTGAGAEGSHEQATTDAHESSKQVGNRLLIPIDDDDDDDLDQDLDKDTDDWTPSYAAFIGATVALGVQVYVAGLVISVCGQPGGPNVEEEEGAEGDWESLGAEAAARHVPVITRRSPDGREERLAPFTGAAGRLGDDDRCSEAARASSGSGEAEEHC